MGKTKTTCLADELARNSGRQVMIGAKSSFFFIGPSEEALREMNTLGLMNKYCSSLISRKKLPKSASSSSGLYIGDRRVVDSFDRGDFIVILIEGSEFGTFWTRDEYLDGLRMFKDALATSRKTAFA